MKKTQEILGLPIICISDGMEVGKVKSIIINADEGAIDYIVVDNGIQILSARVIQTENLLGVGEYAVTIESDSAVTEISKIPAAIDLLQKNIQVKGTKVLTKKGRLIGEIGDIFVDENDNCKIIGLEYIADITQKRIRIIPRDSVITFGKNLVVVAEDVESKLLDSAAHLNSGDRLPEFEKKNLTNTFSDFRDDGYKPEQDFKSTSDGIIAKADQIFATEGSAIYKELETGSEDSFSSFDTDKDSIGINPDHIPQPEGQEAPFYGGGFRGGESPAEQPVQTIPDASEENSAASLFEQRQRQYLNGRRSTKTITDNSGNVIINDGAVITDEVIDSAKQCGKLIELVMNNKA